MAKENGTTWDLWFAQFEKAMEKSLTKDMKYHVYYSKGYTPEEAAYEELQLDWDKEHKE